jgi:activating signal cointegrator 1
MKALSLTQPWATLIAIGAKAIETRSWQTSYRGPLAIHAAKGFPPWARNICGVKPFHQALHALLPEPGIGQLFPTDRIQQSLPLGAIVAVCELVNCVRITDQQQLYQADSRIDLSLTQRFLVIPPPAPELHYGDYTPGRFAWILANVQPLEEPVKISGAQGLWEWAEKPR